MMSVISTILIFIRANILTEYGAAALTASVVGGAFAYAVIAGAFGSDGAGADAQATMRDSGIAIVRPGGASGVSSAGDGGSGRQLCFTDDMMTCSEARPEPGRIVKWCVTEDSRFCRRSAARN